MKLPERKYEPKHSESLLQYVNGWNDCLDEIERLNAEKTEAKDVFDEKFSNSLNMLNNLTIRRSLSFIPSRQEIIEQLMHQEEMQQEKLKKASKI